MQKVRRSTFDVQRSTFSSPTAPEILLLNKSDLPEHSDWSDSDALRISCVAEHGLARLSMGTSQDWQVAVEEGATIIRLGSSLLR